MEEVWKDISGYEGLYQVSNLGNIKSLNYRNNNVEKVLKTHIDTTGYYKVSLYKNKVRKTISVHQLVAQEFLDHHINGYETVINHVNGIKIDNNIYNLESVTNRYNTSDGFTRLNKTSSYPGVCWNKRCQKWQCDIQFNKKGYYLGIFESEELASNMYNLALKSIEDDSFDSFYIEKVKSKLRKKSV